MMNILTAMQKNQWEHIKKNVREDKTGRQG